MTGSEVSDPEAIRQGLVDQIENSVRWKHIVVELVERGMTCGLELGPGSVLQGLVRKVRRDVEVRSVGTCAELENLKDFCLQVETT